MISSEEKVSEDNINVSIFEEEQKPVEELNEIKNTIPTLKEQIDNYVKENNPFIVILTPCFGSVCYVNYMFSLINTISLLKEFNIKYIVEICKNDSLVSRARNNLIAKAMFREDSTHFLFIDNDITWEPLDILKLMISDKSLVGGVYPLKKYNWNNLLENSRDATDKYPIKSMLDRKDNSELGKIFGKTDMIQHNLLNYNINYLSNSLEISNNLARVRHIATGFMMIKRNTIEKMIEAFPSTKYTDDIGYLEKDENKYAYALFDCGVEEGHYFSEDWLFCDRWMKMGGNIYIDVSINLKHTGIEDYNGSYLASIL